MIKNQRTSLANTLRRLRLNAGYTQQNLADALNINRSTYTYYETGKTTPDIHTLKTLAKILGVPVQTFLDEENITSLSDFTGRRPKRIIEKNPTKIGELSSKEKSLIALLRSTDKKDIEKLIDEMKNLFISESK